MNTATLFERRLAEEAEAERLAGRQVLVDEIAKVRAESAPKISAAAKTAAAAECVFNEAKATLDAAEANYRTSQSALAGLKAESADLKAS